MKRVLKITATLVVLFLLPPAYCEQTDIDYLLNAIKQSDCEFWRNGKRHSAEEAFDHLQMKYRRAKKRVTTAEDFIDKLASRSSLSGKPYTLSCPDGTRGPTEAWFRRKLTERSG